MSEKIPTNLTPLDRHNNATQQMTWTWSLIRCAYKSCDANFQLSKTHTTAAEQCTWAKRYS